MNEKRQFSDDNIKMIQILVLSDKDFKAAIMKMLQKSIINSLETNKKIRNSQPRHKSFKKEQNGDYRTK